MNTDIANGIMLGDAYYCRHNNIIRGNYGGDNAMLEHMDSATIRFFAGVVIGFVVTQTAICIGMWMARGK